MSFVYGRWSRQEMSVRLVWDTILLMLPAKLSLSLESLVGVRGLDLKCLEGNVFSLCVNIIPGIISRCSTGIDKNRSDDVW